MAHPVNDHALDIIFRDARSQNGYLEKDVPEVLIRAVYDLAKMGPTSANCSPERFVFIHTPEAKARLLPLMSEGNRAKTAAAPWTVIIAHDFAFQERSRNSSRTIPARRTGSTTTAMKPPSATARCRPPI